MREKFQLEFIMHSSMTVLYNYISSSSGLSEWFADHVRSLGEKFTFRWDKGNEEVAFLIRNKAGSHVRFRWEQDENTKYFFEMEIKKDEITGDVSLFVTDFADPGQVEEATLFWKAQIRCLERIVGR
ncbi:START-like domain-containing protein [Bacteroidetes bacterium endosymbiont of Geopemphigus sp.]|uniref:START-like domain-containing protein n=1 Tax=Bacteroidetes bacterium endosymbiont of Geopemphigus sp. TaxID=2047937 RepID=UPI0018A853D2|nr:START-like domain-containing protein [Bacteroidetes bacterium endosymbiont of Geopemphigus sp.]